MEFKDVAHYYLGSGLKMNGMIPNAEYSTHINGDIILSWASFHQLSVGINKFEPYLRPLSQLTEEIEHNGERFVPIEKLKKRLLVDYELKTGDGVISLKSPIHTYLLFIADEIVEECPFGVFELLIKWHFNVFNIKDYIELK